MHRILFMQLIRLRWKRFHRRSRDMNALLWLALGLLLIVPLARLQEVIVDRPVGIMVSAAFLVMLYGVHQTREDLPFMRHISSRPEWLWLGEYLLTTLPFSILLLLAGNWPAALVCWAGCLAIAWLPIRRQRAARQLYWGRLFPVYLYEWVAGMRQTGWLILPLHVAALVLPFFLPFISFFLLWFSFGLIAGFYREHEPLNLLLSGTPSPRGFLHRKISRHLTAGWILVAPVCLVYGLLYMDQWWLPLIFLLLNTMQHLFFLLNKYATYRPATKSGGNSLLSSLVSLSVVLPFLLPLPLILCIRDYGRARHNLRFYMLEKYP